MQRIFIRYPNASRRALEIIIPLTSWLLITMPLWLSFRHPAMVAYLIITFDVYWFYKSFTLAYFAIRSFLTMTAHVKMDWLSLAQSRPEFSKLYQVVIIPEFNEPIHILERTIENLAKQDFPAERIIIVLAQEAKDPEADTVGLALSEKYGQRFGHFHITKHELTPGEVAGKSSNMAWAGREVVRKLADWNIPVSQVLVTSCDADALLHPKYLSALSYRYMIDPEREYHLYEGAILFYSNIWRVPLPSRVYNTMNSIGNLALLSQPNRFIIFSTYSLPLSTAVEAGYWGTDVIPEDYHLFFRVFFTKGTKVKTIGIFLPVLVDAAESKGFFRTIVNQYEQSKRWAWGVSDIPFVVRGVFLHSEIPLRDRVTRLFHLLEHHIFWPSNWFILTIGSILPPLVNPAFGRTILGHNLSQLSSGILTLSFIFILVVIVIDLRTKPPRPKEFAAWKLPFLYLQWLTVPVVSFFLSALPGLDAHTRLMLGKRLEYRVTEKV
jgi:cellulose synthase/poly-beta-1,6-N-acetylglucosamine synthase-like glycosyltransferase